MKKKLIRYWTKKLLRILREAEHVAIVAHANADPDAIASMLLSKSLINAYGINADLICPEGPSRISRDLLGILNIKLNYSRTFPGYYDTIIIVDTSNPAQLGSLQDFNRMGARIILIDHHQPRKLAEIANATVLDDTAASTTELISVILDQLSVRVSREIASMGIMGILYDTGWLRRIGSYTLPALEYLVGQGGSPIQVKMVEPDFSERYARVKAAARLHPTRICRDLIIAITHVGSFESSVARSLIELGADIVVVVGGGLGKARVSVRVSHRALKMGVEARKLAVFIGEKYGGEGGGHPQAAMAHIPWTRDFSELAEELSKSIPGKASRICLEASRVEH